MQGHEIECCLTIYPASVCLRADLAALASILQSVYSVAALLPATQGNTIDLRNTPLRSAVLLCCVVSCGKGNGALLPDRFLMDRFAGSHNRYQHDI